MGQLGLAVLFLLLGLLLLKGPVDDPERYEGLERRGLESMLARRRFLTVLLFWGSAVMAIGGIVDLLG